mgnify:CR=1 FL=1
MEVLTDLGKKELIFTIGRYIGYSFQILKGFLLAKILGPELFGFFGVFLLVQQYLVYSNFGIQYALNIKLSVNDNNKSTLSKSIKSIIDSSFTLIIFSSCLLLIVSLFLIYSKIDFNFVVPKSHFIIGLLVITILFHIQEVFLNVFRIKKEFYVILFTEICISISAIVVIPFFDGIELLYAVIISWILALILSVTIFKINFKHTIRWDIKMVKPLLAVGLPFLLYNFSFNLISMASRSFVAYNYKISEMGFFTFAVSLTTAIMLVFNSVSWIIYPRLITQLSDNALINRQLESLLFGLTKKTLAVLFVLTLSSIMFLPLIFSFLPKYSVSYNTVVVLLINQIAINSAFALTSYLVGRNMFKVLISSSIFALVFCCLLMFLFTSLNFDYAWIAFANLIGSMVFFNYLIFITCRKQKLNYRYLFSSFNFFIQINLIAFALFTLFDFPILGLIIFSVIMMIFLKNDVFEVFKIIKSKISK